MDNKIRCFGSKSGQELYAHYHDTEWGVPIYQDDKLFALLILEGAQAGLNWETVLKKRDGYYAAFHNFAVSKVAAMSDNELACLQKNPNIIRNKLKIFSARNNAQVFLQIQQEFQSFSQYLWSFVNGKPIVNHWSSFAEVPTTTKVSDALSKDLKKRGMNFVGPTIMYAYMQAAGLVNDHLTTCWLRKTN